MPSDFFLNPDDNSECGPQPFSLALEAAVEPQPEPPESDDDPAICLSGAPAYDLFINRGSQPGLALTKSQSSGMLADLEAAMAEDEAKQQSKSEAKQQAKSEAKQKAKSVPPPAYHQQLDFDFPDWPSNRSSLE